MTSRPDPIADEVVSLKCGRQLAYCVHGVADGDPVLFFAGAGMGRKYVPTPFPGLLREHRVRLITIDRPGYGNSDPHPGRTLKDWVGDIRELMAHLGVPAARFIAHSAGTPHLAAVCALAPELVTRAAFVCPATPITGTAPTDRPHEPFGRGVGRFCLLYLGGLLDKVFGTVFGKWQADSARFASDWEKQFTAKKDVEFFQKHLDFHRKQWPADFGDAVTPPNGVEAMLEDMFRVNRVPWGFHYSDIKSVPVQVWWGDADDVAPHGQWVCEQLGIPGECVRDAGHLIIHSEFGPILKSLLR